MMMQSRSFTKVSGPLIIVINTHWWTDRKHSRCLRCHAVAPIDKLGVAKLSLHGVIYYCECAIRDGIVSVIQNSRVSAIQGFLMC